MIDEYDFQMVRRAYDRSTWIDVARESEFPSGTSRFVEVDGVPVEVFRLEDGYCAPAYDDVATFKVRVEQGMVQVRAG